MASASSPRAAGTPPTSGDVARAAGVSRATVSYVLNDTEGGRVSEATRHRVREAARQLGYVPHAVARALRAGRSGIVLLTAPAVTVGPLFAQAYADLQQALAELGHTAVLYGPTGARGAGAGRRWAELRPDAVLSLMDDSMDEDAVAVLHKAGVEVVLSAGPVPVPGAHALVTDQEQVGFRAVEHLGAAGRRTLGVLVPADASLRAFAESRLAGAERAARAQGAVTVVRQELAMDEDAARGWAQRCAEAGTDGLFAYNDEYAALAVRALQDTGRRVPEDVAVVGADDLLIGRLLRPRLTTVRMDYLPPREIAGLLDRLIGAPGTPPETHDMLRTTLVVRESA
ncbi:LacI family DNA-binding transcriptional regulator [Streptomyces sp. AC602_WCS936]|uniref:LacI family DNA-binding transcriptional regulator n=1 Tax=Streptomyces sp. AC602_WCS936 TaxID=2823685 RepID=UPI001C25C963|nr:LacI family DNA-binding transcriptional regulator [Streptomyces sp. AC602_WCS936]